MPGFREANCEESVIERARAYVHAWMDGDVRRERVGIAVIVLHVCMIHARRGARGWRTAPWGALEEPARHARRGVVFVVGFVGAIDVGVAIAPGASL